MSFLAHQLEIGPTRWLGYPLRLSFFVVRLVYVRVVLRCWSIHWEYNLTDRTREQQAHPPQGSTCGLDAGLVLFSFVFAFGVEFSFFSNQFCPFLRTLMVSLFFFLSFFRVYLYTMDNMSLTLFGFK